MSNTTRGKVNKVAGLAARCATRPLPRRSLSRAREINSFLHVVRVAVASLSRSPPPPFLLPTPPPSSASPSDAVCRLARMTAAPPPAPTHVREDPRFAEPRPQHHPRRVAATPTTPSTRPTTTFPLDADVPPAPSSSGSPTDGVGVGVGVGARANGKAAAAAAATTTTTREAEDDATVPSSDADAAEDPPDPAATIADLRRKLLAASNVRAAMEAALDESEARTREARASEAAETAARLAAAEARCEDVLLAANRAVDAARNRQTAAERRANESEKALEACALVGDRRCEASLKAAWLSHYWRLASELGVMPSDVASREMARWGARAPKRGDDALHEAVERAARAGGDGGMGGGAPAGASRRGDNNSFGPPPSHHKGRSPKLVSDALEIETALRTMTAMRVEEGVLVALADRRRAIAAREMRAAPRGSNRGATSTANRGLGDADGWLQLSPEEEREVVYRRAWLCFLWLRARAAGLEPGLADARCERWLPRALAGPGRKFDGAREALEVEAGLAELRELGVESALWEKSRVEARPAAIEEVEDAAAA